MTGGTTSPDKYKAMAPGGRAFLKAAEFSEPPEWISAEYPLIGTTGRSPYQFHTRTKTGRSRKLRAAAPSVWVELSAADAAGLNVAEGDQVRVESARGSMVGPARIGTGRDGVVFVPFHFGYFDSSGRAPDGQPTAANEFTLTEWDPVSKQPLFKVAAVRVTKED
jgi:anaerobic selenocysteine-containing dehydrogenase